VGPEWSSELYFVQIDPACQVLCSTEYEGAQIPIAWTSKHGEGSVFYTSLAHEYGNVTSDHVTRLLVNGVNWAARD
jgi:uncharacterized protein